MKFVVKKEDLYNGIKIVERATSMKALQPVLLNILIETIEFILYIILINIIIYLIVIISCQYL